MSSLVHHLTEKGNIAGTKDGIGGNFPLDENVKAGQSAWTNSLNIFLIDLTVELPLGTKVLAANTFGFSAWTVTARIDTADPNGQTKAYFLKVLSKAFLIKVDLAYGRYSVQLRKAERL